MPDISGLKELKYFSFLHVFSHPPRLSHPNELTSHLSPHCSICQKMTVSGIIFNVQTEAVLSPPLKLTLHPFQAFDHAFLLDS